MDKTKRTGRSRSEVKGREMPKQPIQADASGRVSPTAPRSKSLSAAVWDYLESTPGFNERLDQGKASLDSGQRVQFEGDRKRR
jgi:hypothetical protein